MPSTNEYYKEYRKGERAVKNGDREDLTDKIYAIKFSSKNISISQFKKIYKPRIQNKEQQYIFNNCIDLIELIQSTKECLEQEGTYIKNCTGTLKVNPAQKELRENLKAFNTQLELLNNILPEEDEEELDDWLDKDE